MNTFLQYVARDIISKYGDNLSRIAVIFPNKRAALFFNEYLACIAAKPIWSPSYITISDFFQRHSQLRLADPIKLICELHKCFTECTGSDETLDHFYGWGQILLADFDDIDKNMADARAVFSNLRDIHELDDASYLTQEQIEIIKKFFSNFSEEHNSELKRRFLTLWSHLYDIYRLFNSRLEDVGITYEGALYRKVATDDSLDFMYDKYLFIGFNVLQKVERTLFKRLREEGRAEFYWDFDRYYMPKKGNVPCEAGHYIASYLRDFPNELDINDKEIYDNFSSAKDITYISAPTENIQARYISTWLREKNRIADGRKTAIVLCNEGLLQSVIHCLPDEVEKVNITTGYPLSQSPVVSLITLLISLQTSGYVASSDKYRLRNVNALLRHPYMKYMSGHCEVLHRKLNIDAKIYYPDREILCIDDGLSLLFANINNDTDIPLTGRIVNWLVRVIKHIAVSAGPAETQLFQESVFRTYTLMNRISGLIMSGDLNVDIITLQRLIGQLVRSTSIPFHGEPVVGTQIMGVLETRNLDFEHLLILSVNEGNMPKGVNDTSFIPYNIRKAHELTTIDNKVAIYAYYFYRLLQRAKDITVVYNNSTENGKTGEMSRFMLQIMVESGHNIARKTLQAGHTPQTFSRESISKTGEIMRILRNRFDKELNKERESAPLLTPTAINRYMRCPKQFFYNYVCGIKEPEEDNEDEIDNRVFGNIFHEASQRIYELLLQKSNNILATEIKRLLDTRVDIERVVDETFKKELFKMSDMKARPEYNGLQLINREVIITYLRKLLRIDMQLTPFHIIGLEIDVTEDFHIDAGNISFDTTIGGRIDRLDRVSDGTIERIRVIDYKTGSRQLKEFNDIEAIFDSDNILEHSDYYLQTFLYSKIVRMSSCHNGNGLPVSPALLFIQRAADKDYDPTLRIGKQPVFDIAEKQKDFERLLKAKINEIFNPEIPFIPTDNDTICQMCPYMQICNSAR